MIGITRNGPPAPLQITAINLELQAQNNESHVISVMRMSDMHCSCLTGLQKTCRNLLCRTILLIVVAVVDSTRRELRSKEAGRSAVLDEPPICRQSTAMPPSQRLLLLLLPSSVGAVTALSY